MDFNAIREERGIVVLERTERRYETPAQIEAEVARIAGLYPPARRDELVLVRDLRRVAGETDATLEAVRVKQNERLVGGWRHVVVLVDSEVGRLHVQRVLREMNVQGGECFVDAAAAFARARQLAGLR